jgi:hypothetical protein
MRFVARGPIMHIERSHSITLPLPIEHAFPLFTPIGEIDWAPGWQPDFLYPKDGATQAGMVFTTAADGVTTLWACTDWAPAEHRVRYARVTPGNRFGFVDVHCTARGPETNVEVGYQFTALGPEGGAYMASLTPEAFAAMIEQWKQLIEERIVGK